MTLSAQRRKWWEDENQRLRDQNANLAQQLADCRAQHEPHNAQETA